ncbi:MAG TPA: hypothetical protein VE869_02735 [Gemmatimonas sp.]|nr:hypothetical protein [Gemmatimonas sp.]
MVSYRDLELRTLFTKTVTPSPKITVEFAFAVQIRAVSASIGFYPFTEVAFPQLVAVRSS